MRYEHYTSSYALVRLFYKTEHKDMKRTIALLALILSCCVALGQRIFSVETCPAENASTAMNVSWATAPDVRSTYVVYTEASDTLWRHARRASDINISLCNTFDSIYSKTPYNKDVYERWIFNKCGATLRKLKRDTDYMYRVVADSIETSEYHFRTAGAKCWSACVISDYHHYTPLPKRLQSAMTMIDTVCRKDPSLDWILHLGDVTAWGGSYSFWKTMYESPIFGKYMWAGVIGNHDYMSRKYAKCTNQYFRDANYYPRNGYQGEEGVCYYFHYGDALFVMLDNEAMRSDEGLAQAQEWFRSVMRTERSKARYIIVCEHYQWFMGNDGKASQYDRWSKLFDEYGVDLALAGNNHIYVRTGALYDGHETDGTKGTVYIQSTSSDNERGQAAAEWTLNRNIIKKIWTEGEHTVSAIHLEATPKTLTLTLYDRHGTAIDRATILAKKRK